MYSENTNAVEGIDKRTIKAATESMTIVALGRGEYKVYSGVKNAYVVNVLAETCECADAEYNHPVDGCKHRQRVEMEIGQREIPDLGRRTDVEIMTGVNADEEPVAIADGGREVDLREEFDDSVRSAGSMMRCPDCEATIPSQQQTDFSSNIRREFPSSFDGCQMCGFDGTVFARFNADMDRVEEQIVRQQDQEVAIADGGQLLEPEPQGSECDHPDCEHGLGKERPELCWPHWEARQEARR